MTPVSKEAPADPLLSEAVAHHQAGRTADAARLYRRVLARNPRHLNALMLLALLLQGGDRPEQAERYFSEALAVAPGEPTALHQLGCLLQRRGDDAGAIGLLEQALSAKPDEAAIHNDLGVSLQRLNRREEALAAFEQAIALKPDFIFAQGNRGMILAATDRAADAIEPLKQALAAEPTWAEAWFSLGNAYREIHDLDQAETAYRKALSLDPGLVDAYLELAHTIERAHRQEEADRLRAEAARRRRVVTLRCIGGKPKARLLLIGASARCNLSTDFIVDRALFETVKVTLLAPEEADTDQRKLFRRLPSFDLAFNTIADPDRGVPFLPAVSELLSAYRGPILNPPGEAIARTRRDRLPDLLRDIPGLAVPETRRMSREDLERLARSAAPFEPELLLRPAGAHGGDDFVRIGSTAEISAYLDQVPDADFYATDYWDYQNADGFYRKYRVIFIDRQPFAYHLAIARQWLVHYFRADMAEAEWMRREEETFLADYRNVFSGALAEAVQAIGQRLDLDYAGMDCGVARDGRLLVFEANPSMLVHLNEPHTDFAYKHRYVPRIAEAVSRMIMARIGVP